MSETTETSKPPTLSVVTFVLALLALLLGFHNVTQRSAAVEKLDGLARSHARANAESRLTALEAERDALRDDLGVLTERLEAVEQTGEGTVEAP